MLQDVGIMQFHARTRIKMALTTRFTDYRPFADKFFRLLDMGNILIILLLSVNFPSISHIHALSMGLTIFGITFVLQIRPHLSPCRIGRFLTLLYFTKIYDLLLNNSLFSLSLPFTGILKFQIHLYHSIPIV